MGMVMKISPSDGLRLDLRVAFRGPRPAGGWPGTSPRRGRSHRKEAVHTRSAHATGPSPAEELVGRSESPWDSSARRPSHADKRRAWRRVLLGAEIRAVLRPGVTEAETRDAADRLLS